MGVDDEAVYGKIFVSLRQVSEAAPRDLSHHNVQDALLATAESTWSGMFRRFRNCLQAIETAARLSRALLCCAVLFRAWDEAKLTVSTRESLSKPIYTSPVQVMMTLMTCGVVLGIPRPGQPQSLVLLLMHIPKRSFLWHAKREKSSVKLCRGFAASGLS